jgi:putative heme-binding domain-containing protein
MNDPRGHGVQVKAPAGWIARIDLDGKDLDLVSAGYRNIFDIAFNPDGELFTFDSDMEWDIGAPWYRPTRVLHVTSGSDFGFRAGNGPWPAYFIDTLPSTIDVGPSSPTGMVFGTGTKFPPRYQQALFAGDWSYGNIFVFHIHPEGSSYRAEMERFASAMPLGVTDMVVGKDGALYFAVGGRESESALYRIVWDERAGSSTTSAAPPVGATKVTTTVAPGKSPAPAAAISAAPSALSPSEARTLRRKLEGFHIDGTPADMELIWQNLGNPDRFISTAARGALEHQPLDKWRDRALAEPNLDARLNALVAFAHVADRSQQSDWVKAVTPLRFADLTVQRKLNVLRAAALGVIRFDPLEPPIRQQLIDAFRPQLPANHADVDRQLSHLLVRLKAPNLIEPLLVLLEKAGAQEESIDLAITLANVDEGWTIDQRRRLLQWFDKSSHLAGGMSFFGYLSLAREHFVGFFNSEERTALAEWVNKPYVEAPVQLQSAARPFVREWKYDELVDLVEKDKGPRHFENGRNMFSAAGCYNCHRVAGSGSSVGPDLTGVGGRFGVRDLLRAVIDPNQTISDQYEQMSFEVGGRVIVGRVTNISKGIVSVNTNMLDPKAIENIQRNEIDNQSPSKISMMPAGLLNTLSAEEILDLIAFLRSGGRADADLFANQGR